jgi:predicted metal-dependent phosphoesterase TrpH
MTRGGLALIPHPFCTYRSSALSNTILRTVIGEVDIIEGYNARTVRDEENRLAREFAEEHRKPISVGSDAHTWMELGRCWLDIRPFETPAALLRNLGTAGVQFRPMPSSIHYITKIVKKAKHNPLFQD